MRLHRTLAVPLALALGVLAGCGAVNDEPQTPVCVKEPSFFYQPGILFPQGGFGEVWEITRLTSDQFCRGSSTWCPPTPEAGRAALRFGSGPTIVVRGCGLESLQRRGGLYGRILTYDATGALIGAASYEDVSGEFGGCIDNGSQWGEGPPLPDTVDAATKALLTHRTTCADLQIDEEPLQP